MGAYSGKVYRPCPSCGKKFKQQYALDTCDNCKAERKRKYGF